LRLSIGWLRELVEVDSDHERLAERLTMRGINVERIVPVKADFTGVLVGEVVSVAPHPSSEKLRVCQVKAGEGTYEVVCGARNVRAGLRSALAPPGSRLPGGEEVAPSQIGGITSEGMLCSSRELDIGEDASGILELPEDLESGSDLEEALGLKDVILDIEVTHNRPDHNCVVGVAREVAALYGVELKRVNLESQPAPVGDREISVEIEDREGCPFYAGWVVRGVSVRPSPAWLTWRLKNVGVRSINNIVDCANYLLLETGQPTHCFDLDTLSGRSILIRRARSGESLRTLDGVERVLDPAVMVIADREKPVALAGVMGGEETEVRGATRSILVESAYFDPPVVRASSEKFSLPTEASARFARGVDPAMVVPSGSRLASMIRQVAGGTVAGPMVTSGVLPETERVVELSPGTANRLIGVEIGPESMKESLESLGFSVRAGDRWSVKVPSHRADVREEVDLIEEIARSHGYDRIPVRNFNPSGVAAGPDALGDFLDGVRQSLVRLGLSETVTRTLVAQELLKLFAGEEPPRETRVDNPVSKEESVLRSSLLPGLLKTVSHNVRHGRQALRIFETGKVFDADGAGGRIRERYQAAVALGGERDPVFWGHPTEKVDFFDLKGIAEGFLDLLGVDTVDYECYDTPWSARGTGLRFTSGGKQLGVLGVLCRACLDAVGIEEEVFCGVFDLEVLRSWAERPGKYRRLTRFPGMRRDIAFVVDERVSHSELVSCLSRAGGKLLESITLFDVYRGKPIPAGRKSLAYSLSFRSGERTLSDTEIDKLLEGIKLRLTKDFAAEIREG